MGEGPVLTPYIYARAPTSKGKGREGGGMAAIINYSMAISDMKFSLNTLQGILSSSIFHLFWRMGLLKPMQYRDIMNVCSSIRKKSVFTVEQNQRGNTTCTCIILALNVFTVILLFFNINILFSDSLWHSGPDLWNKKKRRLAVSILIRGRSRGRY